jgi:hypothetical protein
VDLARDHERPIGMRGTVFAAIMIFAFASSACGGHASSETEAGSEPQGVFFPRLTEHSDTWPAALASGTLAEKEGCVILVPGDMLLIWPHEANVERTGSGALRITVGGDLVGQTGDDVQLGGGLLGEAKSAVDQAERLIGEPIPDRCRAGGGYWLTAPPM